MLDLAGQPHHWRDGVMVLAQRAVVANEGDLRFARACAGETRFGRTDGAPRVAPAVDLVAVLAHDLALAEPVPYGPIRPDDAAILVYEGESGADDADHVVKFPLFAKKFLSGMMAFCNVEHDPGVSHVLFRFVQKLAENHLDGYFSAVLLANDELRLGRSTRLTLSDQRAEIRLLLKERVGRGLADDLVVGVTEKAFRARVPIGELALEVERDNCDRHVRPDQVQLPASLLGELHRHSPLGDILEHDDHADPLRHLRGRYANVQHPSDPAAVGFDVREDLGLVLVKRLLDRRLDVGVLEERV